MMKITRSPGNDAVTQLVIEGQLTAGQITQEVAEALRLSIEASSTERRPVLLDLSGVTFADPAGVAVLRMSVQRGAVLVGCSDFVSELLREESKDVSDVVRRAATAEHSTEARLVERLQAGDGEAFETLVRQYGSRMLATARRFLPSEPDARDAVQDACLSAFKSIRTFSGDAKLSTWLHRVVVNAALMKIRHKRHRPEESIDELLPRFDGQGCWADAAPQWSAPSDVLLQRQETRQLVRRSIERLPETYRTVLMLRDIEELDTEEAADALGITPNAVKIRLHRARQALRTLMQRELAAADGSTGHSGTSGRQAPPHANPAVGGNGGLLAALGASRGSRRPAPAAHRRIGGRSAVITLHEGRNVVTKQQLSGGL